MDDVVVEGGHSDASYLIRLRPGPIQRRDIAIDVDPASLLAGPPPACIANGDDPSCFVWIQALRSHGLASNMTEILEKDPPAWWTQPSTGTKHLTEENRYATLQAVKLMASHLRGPANHTDSENSGNSGDLSPREDKEKIPCDPWPACCNPLTVWLTFMCCIQHFTDCGALDPPFP